MIRRDRIMQNATKCSRSIDVQRRELNGKLELSFISYIEPAAIDPIVTESRYHSFVSNLLENDFVIISPILRSIGGNHYLSEL